jgi:RNA polymerase sigma-70 factor (subfamily 1)
LAFYRPGLKVRAQFGIPRKLHGKQDPSDIVQEVQLFAARNFHQFKGTIPGDFSAWLRGILDRRIARAIRFWGAKRREEGRERPLPAPGDAQWEPAGSLVSPLDDLCGEEERKRLGLALDWCRDADREVIVMRHIEGLSHEEIAARRGVTVYVSRQQYSRALRRACEAAMLLELMQGHGMTGRHQEVVLLSRVQRRSPKWIRESLGLTPKILNAWLADAEPLFAELERVRNVRSTSR